MRLVSRLAVPVLALAVGAGLTAGPAVAERERPSYTRIVDGRGDMWRVTDPVDGAERARRAPGHRKFDMTGVRVRHTATTVVVRVRLDRLGDIRRSFLGPIVQLRMPAAHVTALVFPRPRRPAEVTVSNTYTEEDVVCPDATVTIRRARRAVEVALPRTCLGSPTWVRARGVTVDFGRHGGSAPSYYADVAPGPGLKLKGALSTRAYAPTGAVVADAPPPVEDFPTVPGRARAVLDRLEQLERLGLGG